MKHILVLITLLSIISCKNTNSDNKSVTNVQNEEEAGLLSKGTSANGDNIADSSASESIINGSQVVDNKVGEKLDAVSGATNVENNITLNGIIVVPPQQHASITSNLSGSVHNVSLLSGSYINRGGIVVTLEVPEFITLQQGYLEYLSQCEYLEKEYERQKSLSMQEAASEKKFQQSKAEYFSMKSKLEAAKAQLTLLNVDIYKLLTDGISPYLEVKSPINGSVTNLSVNVGKYINAGDIICEVVNKQAVMLELTAYEKDLKYLRIGDSINFYVNGLGSGRYVAKISSIDKVVDKTNRSIKVFAKVSGNVEQLNAGMYVSAELLRK